MNALSRETYRFLALSTVSNPLVFSYLSSQQLKLITNYHASRSQTKQRSKIIPRKRVSFGLAPQADLIPKPTITAHRYPAKRLRAALGFHSDVSRYKKFRREVMGLAAQHLTMGETWRSQDPDKCKIFKEEALDRFHVFREFRDNWPIEYLATAGLKAYIKTRQRREGAQRDREDVNGSEDDYKDDEYDDNDEDDEDDEGDEQDNIMSPPPSKQPAPRNERPRRAVATSGFNSSSSSVPEPSPRASTSCPFSRPSPSNNTVKSMNNSGSTSCSQSASQFSYPPNSPRHFTTPVEEFLHSMKLKSAYPFFEDAGIKEEEDLEVFLSWEVERQRGLFDRVVDGKAMSWLQVSQLQNALGHGLRK
ncbi:hypothetical protein JAAARDRAFT_33658 [Jaapia argillacea MUCL 33604]|uniref:Uncharacterized protein n=1 Tax=Jaapia argillacea MUCL 33604 TaxID=933084 RepID=A0A067Q8P3_9AGAM|nr:hypothetical protein JAAARDRAFT_33658 [Jaapia argillacea MUCL 33604]